MEKTGITRVAEINNSKKLLEIINDSLKKVDTIKINEDLFTKFLLYDGKKNALNSIQNNINQIKQI